MLVLSSAKTVHYTEVACRRLGFIWTDIIVIIAIIQKPPSLAHSTQSDLTRPTPPDTHIPPEPASSPRNHKASPQLLLASRKASRTRARSHFRDRAVSLTAASIEPSSREQGATLDSCRSLSSLASIQLHTRQ